MSSGDLLGRQSANPTFIIIIIIIIMLHVLESWSQFSCSQRRHPLLLPWHRSHAHYSSSISSVSSRTPQSWSARDNLPHMHQPRGKSKRRSRKAAPAIPSDWILSGVDVHQCAQSGTALQQCRTKLRFGRGFRKYKDIGLETGPHHDSDGDDVV